MSRRMNRSRTGCDKDDGLGTNASQSRKSILKTGRHRDESEDDVSSEEEPYDYQREVREKFKENAKQLRQEIKEVIGPGGSPLGYDLDCSSTTKLRQMPVTDSSNKDGSGSERSLAFTVGGKSFLMDDPRTLSEIFQEQFGGESAARVYGFSTESLEYLKTHPESVTGPNPMNIPHDEILGILNGFSNIYLAHEISVNPEFRLHRYVPPEDSLPLKIQAQMKKAYWDIFDEHLKETPPNYNQALSVFVELKEILLSLLLPHNHQMRHRINSILQLKHIKDAVVKGTFTMLDFQRYSEFIIETLSQLCCPSRDQDIAALKVLEKPSEIFQGIMEVMEKMKLDMANFFVMQFRPNIVAHCVQYERMRLADFMEAEYRLNSDGLKGTRSWLMRHRLPDRDPELAEAKALGELLNYNPNQPFPEILLLDVRRCTDLSNSLTRLSIIGAIILTVSALAQTFFQPLPFDFRSIFKKHMLILMPLDDMNDKKKFDECVERAAEQAAFIVNEMTKKAAKRRLTKEEKETIRTCVRDVGRPDHKIRSLLGRRILDHAEEIALAQRQRTVTVPTGLSSITHELAISIGEFQRLISHNRRAFRDIYEGILSDEMPPPIFPRKPGGTWDETYVETIEMLRRPILRGLDDYEVLKTQKEEKASHHVTIVEPPKPSRVKFPEPVVSVFKEKEEAKQKTASTEKLAEKKIEEVKHKLAPIIKHVEEKIEEVKQKGAPIEELVEKKIEEEMKQKPTPIEKLLENKNEEVEEGDEEGEYEYEYEEGDEEDEEDDEDEEDGEEDDEEEEEGEEEEGAEEQGAAGPSVPPVPVVPRDPNAVSTFIKPPRVPRPGARIELLFLPRGMPKRYLLKSGSDGISRLIPNLEKSLVKKKKKKRKGKKRVRMLPKEPEIEAIRNELEEPTEINLTPNELAWSKFEARELRKFCCGKPETPEPRPKSDQP